MNAPAELPRPGRPGYPHVARQRNANTFAESAGGARPRVTAQIGTSDGDDHGTPVVSASRLRVEFRSRRSGPSALAGPEPPSHRWCMAGGTFCEACGSALHPGAQFCGKCGHAAPGADAAAAVSPPPSGATPPPGVPGAAAAPAVASSAGNPPWLIPTVIGAVLIAIVALGVILLAGGGGNDGGGGGEEEVQRDRSRSRSVHTPRRTPSAPGDGDDRAWVGSLWWER